MGWEGAGWEGAGWELPDWKGDGGVVGGREGALTRDQVTGTQLTTGGAVSAPSHPARWEQGALGGRGTQCAHEYSAPMSSHLTAPHAGKRVLETLRKRTILNY